MDKMSKDQDQDSDRYEELADRVDELSRERTSLEQRIRELEMRVTGTYGKDEMTYNFIVEKQTTQMQWIRDSPGSPRADGKDTTYQNRNAMYDDSRNASYISGTSTSQHPNKGTVPKIQQLANNEQHARGVFVNNGEVFIMYSPTGSSTKIGGTDERSNDGVRNQGLPHKDDRPEIREASKTRPENSGIGSDGSSDDGIRTRVFYRRDEEPETAPSYDDNKDIQAQTFRRYSNEHSSTEKPSSQKDDFVKEGREGSNQDRTFRNDLDDQAARGRSDSQEESINKPSNKDDRENIQVGRTQTHRYHRDSGERSSPKAAPFEGNDLTKTSNRGRDPMLPQVIVVTGLRHSGLKQGIQECPDEDESVCNCYHIMKESEEWKANVTKLLELLVMNAYGNRCPNSLMKALMDPSTREQAIAELLDHTFPASDNTVSQDNKSKAYYKDRRYKDVNKNKADIYNATENKKDTQGLPRTFAQFPPYPATSFESKDSLPRHTQNKQAPSNSKTVTHSTTQPGGAGHSNKIDIVCPPGSRPIIHIPPSGMPAVTCNNPQRAQDCSTVACCNPKNPCSKHK